MSAIDIPKKAREACVQGTVIARCMITKRGILANCRIIKSLPFMDQPILDALATLRVQPVSFQEKPIILRSYVISLRIKRADSSAAPVTVP